MKVIKRNNIYFIHNAFFEDLYDMNVPVQYVLDSNIIVDLEYLYYFPVNMDSTKKDELMDFLNEVRSKSINYKYALTELSANYLEGGIVDEKYRWTNKAVNLLLKMSDSKLKRHSRFGKNSKENILIEHLQFGKISQVIDKTLKLLVQSYVPLARFFIEIRNMEKNDKVKVFSNFINYLDKEVKACSLYEIVLVIYYLFTNEEEFKHAQSLMKINNKIEIVKKIWNVSWDVTFLRFCNSMASRQLSGEDIGKYFNYVLVTRDNHLGEISSLLVKSQYNNFNGKIIPGLQIEENKIKPQFIKGYQELAYDIMSESKLEERKQRLQKVNPLEENYRLLKLADELTEMLLRN